MEEMHKLSRLLEHWVEHNAEHENNYLQWAERAEANGRPEAAEALRQMAQETRKMESLLRLAREAL